MPLYWEERKASYDDYVPQAPQSTFNESEWNVKQESLPRDLVILASNTRGRSDIDASEEENVKIFPESLNGNNTIADEPSANTRSPLLAMILHLKNSDKAAFTSDNYDKSNEITENNLITHMQPAKITATTDRNLSIDEWNQLIDDMFGFNNLQQETTTDGSIAVTDDNRQNTNTVEPTRPMAEVPAVQQQPPGDYSDNLDDFDYWNSLRSWFDDVMNYKTTTLSWVQVNSGPETRDAKNDVINDDIVTPGTAAEHIYGTKNYYEYEDQNAPYESLLDVSDHYAHTPVANSSTENYSLGIVDLAIDLDGNVMHVYDSQEEVERQEASQKIAGEFALFTAVSVAWSCNQLPYFTKRVGRQWLYLVNMF